MGLRRITILPKKLPEYETLKVDNAMSDTIKPRRDADVIYPVQNGERCMRQVNL